MADIKDRAREYIAQHSEYSEVFGQTFVAVDTLTAMVEFAEQETKELKEALKGKRCNCMTYLNFKDLEKQLTKAKEHIENLLYYVKQCTCERSNYAEIEKDIKEAEQFLNSEVEK